MAVLHLEQRTTDRAAQLFLLLALAASSAWAGDVGLTVTMSPDAARVIRDWRRANGLPQPPEIIEVRAATQEVKVQSEAKDRPVVPKATLIAAKRAAKP